jgi:hypothetical protein
MLKNIKFINYINMNKHLKYINVQNIHRGLNRRTIVAITDIVYTSVPETAYIFKEEDHTKTQ